MTKRPAGPEAPASWSVDARPLSRLYKGDDRRPARESPSRRLSPSRLGHSGIGITLDLYSHVLPGMQEEAAERFDQAFRQAMGGGPVARDDRPAEIR
jgi:hypothetical protein